MSTAASLRGIGRQLDDPAGSGSCPRRAARRADRAAGPARPRRADPRDRGVPVAAQRTPRSPRRTRIPVDRAGDRHLRRVRGRRLRGRGRGGTRRGPRERVQPRVRRRTGQPRTRRMAPRAQRRPASRRTGFDSTASTRRWRSPMRRARDAHCPRSTTTCPRRCGPNQPTISTRCSARTRTGRTRRPCTTPRRPSAHADSARALRIVADDLASTLRRAAPALRRADPTGYDHAVAHARTALGLLRYHAAMASTRTRPHRDHAQRARRDDGREPARDRRAGAATAGRVWCSRTTHTCSVRSPAS